MCIRDSLIDGTVQAVEKGRKIANITAESLHNVVESTNEVLNTVDKIDGAAQHQAGSIVPVSYTHLAWEYI